MPIKRKLSAARAAFLITLPALAVASTSPVHAEPTAAATRISSVLDRGYPALDALYKDIHAHPEVGFQERRTATLLAARMRKLGFTVTEGVGGTGVVAVLRNGEGPTVMVRAEMDALPMEEKTGLPYASKAKQVVDGKESFVAHSCGHDVHLTLATGVHNCLGAHLAKREIKIVLEEWLSAFRDIRVSDGMPQKWNATGVWAMTELWLDLDPV